MKDMSIFLIGSPTTDYRPPTTDHLPPSSFQLLTRVQEEEVRNLSGVLNMTPERRFNAGDGDRRDGVHRHDGDDHIVRAKVRGFRSGRYGQFPGC